MARRSQTRTKTQPSGATRHYEFVSDIRPFNNGHRADAAAIGRAFEAIAQRHEGHLRPEDVVKEARNEVHPLHQYFEWDDVEAARRQRLQTARALIRSIAVVEDDAEEPPKRRWWHIPQRPSSYRDEGTIGRNIDLQLVLLQRARRDLQSWRDRYKSVIDLCDLVQTFETAEARISARAAEREEASAQTRGAA
jgi:hypothetical protein